MHPRRLVAAIGAHTAARALALGAAYAALSLVIHWISSDFGPFWPASGLTVAVLIRTPRRQWPWLLGAVGIAEAAVDLHLGYGLLTGAGWGLANVVEPVVSTLLLVRLGSARPDLASRRGFLAFFGCAVLAGPTAGALIGGATVALTAHDTFTSATVGWLVSDGIGVLVVAPALLARHPARNRRHGLELAALLGVVAAVATATVGPWSVAGRGGLPYLIIPVLVVGALRGGQPSAALGVLVAGLLVDGTTAAGVGPFAASQGPFAGLLVAQMFLAMSAFSAYLVAALTGELLTRDEVEARLRLEADHDPLTGLANRRCLYDHLSAHSDSHGAVLALLYIDLDGFKAVNDDLGHAVGDHLLVETARRIERCARATDIVARIGGDEFLVVARVAASEEAHVLAARIERALREPVVAGARTVRITCSIGVVTSEGGADADTLVADADRAMFVVKRQAGRSRVV